MEQSLHVVPPPTRITYQRLQAFAKQKALDGSTESFAGVDYSSLLTAWAVAVQSRANEPSAGYFYWLGGESIQYQPLRKEQNSS